MKSCVWNEEYRNMQRGNLKYLTQRGTINEVLNMASHHVLCSTLVNISFVRSQKCELTTQRCQHCQGNGVICLGYREWCCCCTGRWLVLESIGGCDNDRGHETG